MGPEASSSRTEAEPKSAPDAAASAESLRRSIYRARRALRDIAACSDFTHFVTLTLDAARIDRYDYDAIIKRVNTWLSNAVARKGLAYVLVPEFHADGAIHFHGLIRGSLLFVGSGHETAAGQIIYNLADWKFGFTACIEISGEYDRVCNYIMKYITKDNRKVGGRWYLSGGDISRPTVSYCDADWREIDAKEYFIPEAAVSFKYLRVDKTEKTD